MRPMITDFSAGELSKKVAGRIDLPIYYKGAQRMLNFFSPQTGGAERRGGFVYMLDAPTNTGKTRLIPWSVGEDLDLMLALSDHSIRLIDVSGDRDPVYLTNMDGSALSITTLDSGGVIQAYAAADLWKVNYAQDRREMVLSCKGYPLFYLKFISKSGDAVSFSYGLYRFSGALAANAPSSFDDENNRVSTDDIADALRDIPDNISINADSGSYIYDDGGVKRYVKSVKLHKVVNSTYAYIKLFNKSTMTLAYTSTSVLTSALYYNASLEASIGSTMSDIGLFRSQITKKISAGTSYKDAIDIIAGTIGISSNQNKSINIGLGEFNSSGYIDRDHSGSLTLYWNPASYSLIITYYNSGTSGATTDVTYSSSNPRDITCSIQIAANDVSINGAKTSGQMIFDSVAAWMIRDKRYLCDQTEVFCGTYVIAVTKQYNGTNEVLLVELGTGGLSIISRESTGLTGRLAVITTPFYEPGDYPETICFHQGRLCVAKGNTIYMSKPNDHSNFEFFEEVEYKTTSLKDAGDWTTPGVPETRSDTSRTQQIGAANAIVLQIATEDDESICWMVSAGDLIIGTTTTEWILPAECDATNSRVIQTSRTGSSPIQARFFGDSVLFVSRSGKSVRMFNPSTRSVSPDISMFADHLIRSGVVSFDFRLDPEQESFFLMADGSVSRLRLTPSSDGVSAAWSKIDSIGVSSTDCIESIATISVTGEDAVFVVIKRTIGGTVRRYIERMMTCDHEVFASRSHLDCSAYVASTSTGYLASIARFGIVDPVKVSFRSSSGIEFYGHLTFTGSNVTTFFNESTGAMQDIPANCEAWIGYSVPSRLETFRIDSQETEGISKATQKIHFRLYESGPFKVYDKHDESCDFEWPTGEMNDIRTIPYTGPITVEYDSGEDTDQSIKVLSDDNQSVNILVIAPNVSIGGNI